jgi:hypothetical protein
VWRRREGRTCEVQVFRGSSDITPKKFANVTC